MIDFHIHVYRIAGKAEFDIRAENKSEARAKALKLAKSKKTFFRSPDCKFIALDFDHGLPDNDS